MQQCFLTGLSGKAKKSLPYNHSFKDQKGKPASSELRALLSGSEDESNYESDEDNNSHVLTLNNITMSVARGTLLGVCGAVGSGKTTLLQSILGIVSVPL